VPLVKEEGYDDDTYSSHVASIALALMMLLSASAFVMGVGGATGDGHVGGPGISDLTSGAGNHDAARAVAGGHREREAGVVRSGSRRSGDCTRTEMTSLTLTRAYPYRKPGTADSTRTVRSTRGASWITGRQ